MVDLFEKVRRRIQNSLERTVAHELHYRPAGVYDTIDEYLALPAGQGSAVRAIYPDLVTPTLVPADLLQRVVAAERPTPQERCTYQVVALDQGRIWTNNLHSVAIVTADNHLLADVSLNLKGMSVGRGQDNVVFKQRYFQPPHRVRGTVFSLLAGGGGAINYGHWLLDVLPRLHLLQRSGWQEQVDWFLVPSLRFGFQRETLELLGIPLHKCLASDEHRHIQADTLLASTSPRGNGLAYPVWAVNYLRETFLPPAGFAGPPLLYVSRRDSRMRTVRNETAVEALLQRYGFVSEVLSPLAMPEKVALFAGARCIVTPTGAGLNNAVFSRPGAHVLELQSTAFLTPDFADLVQKAGLSYEYLVVDDQKQGRNAYQGQRTDLTVDLDQLEQVLHTWQREGRL